MAKVFGISGWKRSGKDTSADYLVARCGFLRKGFADVLKQMVATQYNIPIEACYEEKKKEKPILSMPVAPKDRFSTVLSLFLFREFRFKDGTKPFNAISGANGDFFGMRLSVEGEEDTLYWTPRALCILEGSVKRTVTSDYWTSKVCSDVVQYPDEIKFVISDIRYKSEIVELQKAFGNNLTLIRVNRFDTCDSTDPSERDLDDYDGFDEVIENKGSLEELYLKLDRIIGNGNT